MPPCLASSLKGCITICRPLFQLLGCRHLRLTDLVYADESVSWLAALNICKLSLMPWLADVPCHTWKSVAETNMMVVSTSLTRLSSPKAVAFTCDGLLVEQVDTFKYLGLQLYSPGGISHRITPLKAKATGSWAVVQQRHSQLQCGSTVNSNSSYCKAC